jgi:hypothetical protein
MKKLRVILFLAFSFSFFISADGQFNTYHPFPDSAAWWNETTFWQVNCNSQYSAEYKGFTYFLRGDTVVNSKTYFKLNMSGGFEWAFACMGDTSWQCYNSLYCLLRNDTAAKKVYALLPPYNGRDTLLYDFNLIVGGRLPTSYLINWSDTETVYGIDSVLVGSSYRKQFIIMINSGVYHNLIFDSIVEGVGSMEGLLELMIPPFESGSYLNCFADSITNSFLGPRSCVTYKTCQAAGVPPVKATKESISVYPNPSSGIFSFEVKSEKLKVKSIEVYNVLGQSILKETLRSAQDDNLIDLSLQPNGIYLYRVIAEDGSLVGEGKLIISK